MHISFPPVFSTISLETTNTVIKGVKLPYKTVATKAPSPHFSSTLLFSLHPLPHALYGILKTLADNKVHQGLPTLRGCEVTFHGCDEEATYVTIVLILYSLIFFFLIDYFIFAFHASS